MRDLQTNPLKSRQSLSCLCGTAEAPLGMPEATPTTHQALRGRIQTYFYGLPTLSEYGGGPMVIRIWTSPSIVLAVLRRGRVRAGAQARAPPGAQAPVRRGGSELGLTFVGPRRCLLARSRCPLPVAQRPARPLCGSPWRQSGWRLPFVGTARSAPAVHSELYESNLRTRCWSIPYERNPATELWHSKL